MNTAMESFKNKIGTAQQHFVDVAVRREWNNAAEKF